ncbi:lactonase family protein [Ornithinimicrobium ciconiae]|uniref:Lactonase family protein n=1 Tax=Ornithinimicrobium ciconiae TaxID=2594265 RepID=A0A516GAR5_9MICO|nr:beta-propeller fold lactonase family protein [Ornithinimicrobium ciconiae]QDO88588.1 lactonase family protein [Ornithinimicrobium ciconiae]
MSELILIANADDGSISALRLHRGEAPRLEVLKTTTGLTGCSTFAVDPDRDLVHAAYKGDQPGIATLRLDRTTGALEELSRTASEHSMTYLSLAHEGTVLLGASYGGGSGRAWPVQHEEQVRLGESTPQVSFANLHCVVPAAAEGGPVAYFVSLGDDLVAQFNLDASGTLTPLDPPTVAAPQGSGPRHLVVDGDHAYLVTEFSGEAIRYDRAADGSLTSGEAVSIVDPRHGLAHSRLGADPVQEHLVWGADLHRAGSWLITSERSSSELASIPVDASGRLGEPAHFAPTQQQPRGFNVTADGRFVVSVGERSTRAELLRVEDDGVLTSLGTAEIGRGPNWVRILE